MAVIDTLQILVQADARGIEQTLKKVVSTATGAVSEINKQEVDWTSIFSRAVSPAIIGGIASLFALAISESMTTANAFTNAGVAAGETGLQIAQTGKSALDMSKGVSASATDIQSAMLQVKSVFGDNTVATNDVVKAMSELSPVFGSLNDITSTAVNLFKEFGVTTESQAIDVLTSLMHAAEGANRSIPTLGQEFAQFTPQLIDAGIKTKDLNGILAAFSSEINGIGDAGAISLFTNLATSADKVNGPLITTGLSMQAIKKSLVDDGGLSAIDSVSKAFSSKWGDNATLIATSTGLTEQNVAAFIESGAKFPTIAIDAGKIAKNSQPIADAWAEADTSVRTFHEDWNHLVALVTSGSVEGGMKNIATTIGGMLDMLDKALGALDDYNLAYAKSELGPDKISEEMNKKGDAAINQKLQSSGLGFSDTRLSSIDKTAEDKGVLSALLSALDKGTQRGDSNFQQITNAFHLNIPGSNSNVTGQDIAKALYTQFLGTTK